MSGQLSLAFAAGMVAAFNPCGFAMLPAYMSYFLGLEDDTEDVQGGVLRALGVGAVVTAGFVLVFGIAGIMIRGFSLGIQEYLPYVTVVIGFGVIILGIAMLRGYQLTVAMPKMQKGGNTRELRSMFLFGVSYAIASISCTMPIFISAVLTTFTTSNFGSGVSVFIAYALGMGLILMFVTVALALARNGLVKRLKGAMQYVNKVSGVLLIIAGLYVIYFGYWEIRVLNDPTDDIGGPAEQFNRWNDNIREWILDVGPTRLGLILAATLAAVVVLAVGWRMYTKPIRDAAAARDTDDGATTSDPASDDHRSLDSPSNA